MGFARRSWLCSGNAPFARDLALNLAWLSQWSGPLVLGALSSSRARCYSCGTSPSSPCTSAFVFTAQLSLVRVFSDCVAWLSLLFRFSASFCSRVRVFLSVQAALMVDHAGGDQLLLVSCQDCAWLLQTVLANVA
jgi:hypothetical protein